MIMPSLLSILSFTALLLTASVQVSSSTWPSHTVVSTSTDNRKARLSIDLPTDFTGIPGCHICGSDDDCFSTNTPANYSEVATEGGQVWRADDNKNYWVVAQNHLGMEFNPKAEPSLIVVNKTPADANLEIFEIFNYIPTHKKWESRFVRVKSGQVCWTHGHKAMKVWGHTIDYVNLYESTPQETQLSLGTGMMGTKLMSI